MSHRKPSDICQVRAMDNKKIAAVRRTMLTEDEANRLSETFSVLADPTRARMIHALSAEELCVCDIAAALHMSISAVSHQLRVLRNMRLVKYRKEHKMVFYSLDDEHIETLFLESLKHIRE